MAPSEKNTRRAKCAKLPSPQQELNVQHFSYEEKCFLIHHANYCTNFEALWEMFNMQFDTDRSLDSIERVLTECEDEEFFQLTEAAEMYKKWYTEHPMSPVVPVILLGSRAMRTELRAYLAYHHYHGMDSVNLQESFNLTFPTEIQDSKQITRQLNYFAKENQLLNSLTSFSVRYPWHPQYKPTATETSSSTSKAAAKARFDQEKKTAKIYQNNQAAKAAQTGLLNQRTEREEDSQAAQWELVVKYTDIFGNIIAGPLTPLIFTAAAIAHPLTATIPGSRPGHAAGRARSASPVRDGTWGKGGVTRGRRGSM